MIDAVADVVKTTPIRGVPALVPGRAAITGLYERARGYLARDDRARRPQDVVDVEGMPERRFSRRKLSFVVLVLLPAILGSIYYLLVAADQYVAELRFVVRYGQRDSGGPSATGSGGGGIAGVASSATRSNSSVEDAYIVTSYIRSRAIVDDLLKEVNLREIFTRPEADPVARLSATASVDDLREYWQKMVTTFIDGMSGIVTVEVRAFRREDSVLLAEHIERLAEKLVNTISTRSRQDAVRRASEEVARAQGNMFEALRDVERYRNSEGLIDPRETATDTGKILASVLTDQLAVENQLFVARQSLGPDAPSVRTLQTRLDALRKQVATLRQQLAGKGESRNVAAALVRFEEVSVKQKMAEALYGLAVAGLDKARQSAEAQTLYLTTFVHPRLPEDYTYPKRFFSPFAIAITCLVLWSIGALIFASIEDHRID